MIAYAHHSQCTQILIWQKASDMNIETVKSGYAQRNFGAVLDKTLGGTTVSVERNGRDTAVIMGWGEYNEILLRLRIADGWSTGEEQYKLEDAVCRFYAEHPVTEAERTILTGIMKANADGVNPEAIAADVRLDVGEVTAIIEADDRCRKNRSIKELLAEGQRNKARADANNSWVSGKEMDRRMAAHGIVVD